MATSGTALECSICLEEYNNTSRRPRALPCAHNFCSKCLQNCIAQGSKKCSVCRKKYTAATVEELPIIFNDVENLIEMFKLIAVKVDKTAVNTDKTAEEYMKIKENRLNQTQLDIELFESATTSLKSVLEEKKDNIAIKQAKKVWTLLSGLGAEPIVYLDLEAVGDGKSLGQVRIRLTCGPNRRNQMLMLCTAQQGATWKGRSLSANNVGSAGENINCYNYITSDGTESDTPLVKDLESNQCKILEEGVVTGWANYAGFRICTRGHPSNTIMGYELGRVVAGLDVMRNAIGKYGSNIKIADTGVIIAGN